MSERLSLIGDGAVPTAPRRRRRSSVLLKVRNLVTKWRPGFQSSHEIPPLPSDWVRDRGLKAQTYYVSIYHGPGGIEMLVKRYGVEKIAIGEGVYADGAAAASHDLSVSRALGGHRSFVSYEHLYFDSDTYCLARPFVAGQALKGDMGPDFIRAVIESYRHCFEQGIVPSFYVKDLIVDGAGMPLWVDLSNFFLKEQWQGEFFSTISCSLTAVLNRMADRPVPAGGAFAEPNAELMTKKRFPDLFEQLAEFEATLN